MSEEEQMPVHGYLNVIKGKTLRKSGKFWTAIVLAESEGERRSLRFYRWQKKGEEWRRIANFNINRKSDWDEIKGYADELAQHLE